MVTAKLSVTTTMPVPAPVVLFFCTLIFFFQGVMIATTGGVFCALSNKWRKKSAVICAGLVRL